MKTQITKSLTAILIALIMFTTACNMDCIKGSGRQTTESRDVSEFTKVEFGGNIRLKIKEDSTFSMKITADDNIQKEIKTRVSNGVLEIEMDGNYCNAGLIEIELGAKKWEGIKASGATQIISENQIHPDNFKLDLSGASKVNLDLVTGKLSTNLSGSSTINIKGQARQHDVDLSGAAEIHAYDFIVSDYRIESSGASNCEINVLNSLLIKTSGASKIYYKGNPKQVKEDKNGASSLKHVE